MGVPYNRVSVISNALLVLGKPRIESIAAGGDIAITADQLLDQLLEDDLSSPNWRFATKTASLSLATDAPIQVTSYRYAYKLPADCLAVWRLWPLYPFEIYGEYLFSPANQTLSLEYRAPVPIGELPPSYLNYFVYLLADTLAPAVTESDVVAAQIASKKTSARAQAMVVDSQGSPSVPLLEGTWLQSRFSGALEGTLGGVTGGGGSDQVGTIPDHNELNGLQGGTDDEYYHLTLAKYTVVQNTTGTNTGDQTTTGTVNRIEITNGTTNPIVDIASTYVGQSSITTLGTITTGTWNGSVVGIAYGGSGQTTANAALNAFLPSQTGNSGEFLTTDGVDSSWGTVADSVITFTDITTNNATTSKHGFLSKLSGVATQYQNGEGNWATPAGVVSSYISQAFVSQTSIIVTHNFGTYPVIQVIDNTGAVVIPLSITNNSVNSATITFTASTTGTIMATLGSPQAQAYITVSNDYTTIAGDRFVEMTAVGKTVTLITASVVTEQIIMNSSSGSLTVASAQLISGEASQLLSAGEALSVIFNGSTWRYF